MKNIYTWDAKPARRNLTVADIKAKEGKEKLTQVTANTADEAHAAGEASIDMLICDSKNVETVRKGNSELFLTAALVIPEYPTDSDLLRGAFKALAHDGLLQTYPDLQFSLKQLVILKSQFLQLDDFLSPEGCVSRAPAEHHVNGLPSIL